MENIFGCDLVDYTTLDVHSTKPCIRAKYVQEKLIIIEVFAAGLLPDEEATNLGGLMTRFL